MPEKIRVGIVGATANATSWGSNAHIPALKVLPDYELRAICTAHEESARSAARAFAVDLAFWDVHAMVARPDLDLIVVCVRVPLHFELVAAALNSFKPVLCEWPLGANLLEATEMADLARQKSVRTMVGLQGRSDPAVMFAHDLVRQGYIGDVLASNLTVISQGHIDVEPYRFYQHDRRAGANTLTITAGHALDVMCYILDDFRELSARLSTKVNRWKDTGTGDSVEVTSPDVISVVGELRSGTEVAVHVASALFNPSGTRLEIYGREGTLVLQGRLLSIGPNRLLGARNGEELTEMQVPGEYVLAPSQVASGASFNVTQAYVRIATRLRSGEAIDVDFDLAVQLHDLLSAIERSADQGKSVRLT